MTASKGTIQRPTVNVDSSVNSLGKNLVTIWARMLEQQAELWNENWKLIVGGNYEIKDWFKAVGKSLQISSSTMEQTMQAWSTTSPPPWASLAWPPNNEVPVTLKQPLGPRDQLTLTPFSRLGGDPPKGQGSSIQIVIRQPSSSVLALSVKNTPAEAPYPGQYIGFVVSSAHAEPLVILTVTVNPPSTTPGTEPTAAQ